MQQPNCSNTSLTVTSAELIAVQYKTIQYSKDTTCLVTHNMSGHTTTECPHKS